MTYTRISLSAFALCLSTSANADVVHSDDVIVTGNLCAGPQCVSGEPFPSFQPLFKLNGPTPAILFEDSSTGSNPSMDWRLRANTSTENLFAIENTTLDRTPFRIDSMAPDNSLVLSEFGKTGLGTSLPAEDLHIVTITTPEIRLEETDTSPYVWDIGANSVYFYIQDVVKSTLPVTISSGLPSNTFVINQKGFVGLGTPSPGAQLELSSAESFNFFRITATGAAVNESVDITFTGGPLGTGQLRYNIVDGDNQEMSLDADGNMILDGTLTTTGPTCTGGCDRVFDEDYALPSIPDHAAQMFADGHLPSVGPSLPGQSMNVTEKMGAMLNELEHAHIYIEQLHTELFEQKHALDALSQSHSALLARLEMDISQ